MYEKNIEKKIIIQFGLWLKDWFELCFHLELVLLFIIYLAQFIYF